MFSYQPASIDPRSHLGDATVWQFSTVEAHVTCGSGCVIGSCAWIGKGTVMGDNVRIQHGAFVCRGSEIGHRVFIGPNATLSDDRYPRSGNTNYAPNPPIIRDGASIGAGAVVLAGVTIGRNAMVGAGAVVVEDVPDGETVAGVPARVLAKQGSSV